MKLPALWIAAAFAGGIALASHWPKPLGLWLAGAIAALLLGALLLWRSRNVAALGVRAGRVDCSRRPRRRRRARCGSRKRRRADDRVEALVRARPPRNFLDPGAFDERGYLARQKIDLSARCAAASSCS